MTLLDNGTLTLSVTIKCTKSISLANAISDFTYGPRTTSLYTVNQALGTYDVSPSACPKGTITKQLLYYTDAARTSAATLPSFISPASPTTQFSVATTDITLAGDYYLKVVATESLSGLTNEANAFTLTVSSGYFISDLSFTNSIPD